MSDLIWLLIVIPAAILAVRWYQTGKAPWIGLVLAALPLAAALLALQFVIAGAARAELRCEPVHLAARALEIEARRLDTKFERLIDPGEVDRYLKVLNEEPPESDPAEQLLILVDPDSKFARVYLVHERIVCERFVIGPELHEKAWRVARGRPT